MSVPDPFMLAAVLVIGIMLVFGNIYFIAHYAHHADSFFGSSTACKAILVSHFRIYFARSAEIC